MCSTVFSGARDDAGSVSVLPQRFYISKRMIFMKVSRMLRDALVNLQNVIAEYEEESSDHWSGKKGSLMYAGY